MHLSNLHGTYQLRWNLSFVKNLVFFVESSGIIDVQVPGTQEVLHLQLTLSVILKFVTGSPALPPVGFVPTPSIQFHETSIFPMANTCTNTLHLPLQDASDDEFKYRVLTGIVNAAGFGKV